MSDFAVFILPPATALAGMRIAALLLGRNFTAQFGYGLRFAVGLAVGMLVFSQAVLLFALGGFNASFFLAWLAIVWGIAEFGVFLLKIPAAAKTIKIRPPHLWLVLLLPLAWSWWVFARLSTLEGTLEFDANAFWVFKSKILYLEQGKNLIHILRDINLGYAHMDYPMLVPCLYTLNYGLMGSVDEFVNKVWPLWIVIALCAGIVSAARLWKNPRPLPIAVVTVIAFMPATLEFIRNEGGTIPMVFYTSLAVLLIVTALYTENPPAPAALVLVLAGCFSTKFEGILFAAFTSCALLPFALKRSWLKNPTLWKTAVAAAICIVPYLLYRLAKPVSNTQSAWLHTGLAAPGAVLHRFPQVWFMNFFARFFNPDFFSWQAQGNHLHWTGHWSGWSSLVNDQLAVLPWLLVVLVIFTFIYKSRGRPALAVISAVILVILTFLAIVISCLDKDDLEAAISFAGAAVARYYYPFFTAWFLGTAAIWFMDDRETAPAKTMPVSASVTKPQPEKPSAALSPRPKRRR